MKLSKVAQAFIAGLLTHAREYTAVTNQWVNSYKRLFPQALPDRITEAPAYVCWGHLNRSALVRVPAYGKPNSARVEVRSLDSRLQPVPGLRGHARRRPQGHRGGLRAAAGRRGRRVVAVRRGATRDGLRDAAGEPGRGDRRDGEARSWWPRCSASTCSTSSCATSAPSGRTYRRVVTPYERQRYLGAL